MKLRRAASLPMLVAALVLGACGTTDDGGADSTTTTAVSTTTTSASTTTTEPTTTTEAVSEEGARAGAANLVATDFSDEWSSQPHEDSGQPNLIEVCAADIDLEGTTLAKADSDDFVKGDLNTVGQQVQSSTRLFEDEAAATEAITTFSDAAFVACADANVKEEFAGAEITGDLEAQPGIEGYGDQAEGIAGELTIVDPASPTPVTLAVAVLGVRTGDIATVITGLSVGGPGDPVFDALATAVAERQAS
ncbi:MAG: hypothetical protein WKF43_17375 [Acidimicrobiales bacterium]